MIGILWGMSVLRNVELGRFGVGIIERNADLCCVIYCKCFRENGNGSKCGSVMIRISGL